MAPVDLMKVAVGSLAGVALNVVFSRSGLPAKLVDGSPLWSYYCAGLYQIIVFPLLLVLSVLDKGPRRPFKEYISCSISEAGSAACGSMFFEELLMYAVITYFVRDLVVMAANLKDNATFVVHHLVCSAACVYVLNMPEKHGATIFAFGTIALELGSFAMNIWLLDRSSAAKRAAYRYIMTFSNIVGAVIMPYTIANYTNAAPTTLLFIATAVPLCILRQHAMVVNTSAPLPRD